MYIYKYICNFVIDERYRCVICIAYTIGASPLFLTTLSLSV